MIRLTSHLEYTVQLHSCIHFYPSIHTNKTGFLLAWFLCAVQELAEWLLLTRLCWRLCHDYSHCSPCIFCKRAESISFTYSQHLALWMFKDSSTAWYCCYWFL